MEEAHEPGDDLRALTAAVYRPDATAADVDRLRRARERLAAQELAGRRSAAPTAPVEDAPPPVAPGDAGPPPPGGRRPRLRGLVVALALLAAGAVGFGLGSAGQPGATAPTASVSAQERLKDRVATSAGVLVAQDYYRVYPDDLPLDWGGAATGTSFRALSGPQRLQVAVSPVSRFLLVVVTCPAADGDYTWRLPTGSGATHHGRCGGLDGEAVRLPDRSGDQVPLEVAVSGSLDYGVTALER